MTITCRSCRTEFVPIPGRPGPKPTVCAECKTTKSKYALMSDTERVRHRERVTERIGKNRELHGEYTRRMYWRRKLAAIEALGGKCVRCGTADPIALSINHIDGRVNETRDSKRLHQAAIDGEPGLDLRCMNCQRHWEYERGVLKLPEAAEFDRLREWMTNY